MLTACKDDMTPREAGDSSSPRHVLIAGESTSFKNRVVGELIERLSTGEYYFRITGLDRLEEEDPHDYGAIVVATWYSQKKIADKRASRYIRRRDGDSRLIVLYTHGGGRTLPRSMRPELDVDAVGSPSRDSRVAETVEELVELIQAKF
jgi:hypothetical protein